MSVKEQVLTILEEEKGCYLSGEDMATQLGVSRNAIWKAIRQLQKEGHLIEGVPRLGYTLRMDSHVLSVPGIKKYLQVPDLELTVYPTLPSTNTALKQAAEAGAPAGTVLIAEEQTAGRGRLGRSFYSPAGTGLYFSVLLRPTLPATECSLITTCAAVACAEAMETISGQKTEIKWVNDIYVDGRKACGILTEAALDLESGGLQYAVLGIGINLAPPEQGFPTELQSIAGPLFPDHSGGDVRNRLTAEILNRFFQYYPDLTEKSYLEAYRQRSMLTGQSVYVLRAGDKIPAKVLGIDKDFGLIVAYESGQTEHLSSGEVSIRKRTAESPKI